MGTIRLNGLVGTMNRVRAQLATGIPPEQMETFRTNIQRAVAEVEKICASNNVTPAQLSVPSRNAYLYLKNLDLENLSVLSSPDKNHSKTLRVQNLIRIETEVQAEIARLAESALNPQARTELRERIETVVRSVDEIARQANSSPSQLPLQSRQVYEWLAFLAVPENLDAHIDTVRDVLQEVNAFTVEYGVSNPPHVRSEFAQFNGLFRIRRSPQEIRLAANEGFIRAPRPILQALVRLAFQPNESTAVEILREYARGDEFGEMQLTLSQPTMELETRTRGQHYDLSEIFTRINLDYFQGKLGPPRLVWNRTLTFRKMGHYVPSTDTIMLSLTLDDARVPRAVVDLVMYHELLHKVMGSQTINRRHYAHTPAFRQAERRFVSYAETETWLKEWARQFGGFEEEMKEKSL